MSKVIVFDSAGRPNEFEATHADAETDGSLVIRNKGSVIAGFASGAWTKWRRVVVTAEAEAPPPGTFARGGVVGCSRCLPGAAARS